MFKVIISILTVVSVCLLAVLLNTTTPISGGPFGILIIFVFAYLSLIGFVTYFLYGISRIVAHLFVAIIARKPFEILTFKRSYYYSTIIAAGPVMLIGLQSVGTVGLYEYILIFIFISIGCLYVSKKTS